MPSEDLLEALYRVEVVSAFQLLNGEQKIGEQRQHHRAQ
jgi:hypothetical protein